MKHNTFIWVENGHSKISQFKFRLFVIHGDISLLRMSFTCSVVNVRRPRIDVQHFVGLFSELYVAEEKEDAHEEADGADGDVGNAEERIPPAKQRRRGDDHTLGAAELLDAKSVVNIQGIFSRRESGLVLVVAVVVNFPVKLSEVWECCCPHPNNQVLVLQAIIAFIFSIQFPQIFMPVSWFYAIGIVNS